MPWNTITLNDGAKLPEIGWGSWTAGAGQTVTDQVEQAIEVGFDHIDTAQAYRNEYEVGLGLKEGGLSRKDLWVTTKWSGVDGRRPAQSIHESLERLGLKSVDLYLIHHPRLTNGDPAASWTQFEELKKEGLTKSIGVSNFQITDLEAIKKAGLSTPTVNQILLHPYVYARTKDLLEYHSENGIVTEAYSTLYPITHETSGPVTAVITAIGVVHSATPAAVLFAWARSKGAVIVTSSRQKERLEDYLSAGDLELTPAELASIDKAGASLWSWKLKRRAAGLTVAVAVFAAVKWFTA